MIEALTELGIPILAAAWRTLQKALMSKGMTQDEADAELFSMVVEATAADAELEKVQAARLARLKARLG